MGNWIAKMRQIDQERQKRVLIERDELKAQVWRLTEEVQRLRKLVLTLAKALNDGAIAIDEEAMAIKEMAEEIAALEGPEK